MPAAAYFTAVGLEQSYGKPSQTTPDFAALVADTGSGMAEAFGISTAAGSVLISGVTGALLGAFAQQIFPFATFAGDFAIVATTSTAAVDTAAEVAATTAAAADTAVATVSAGAVAAGPAAIVFLCLITAGVAAYELVQNQQNLDQVNNLRNLLAQAQNNPPDLNAFAEDTSGLGVTKLDETLVAQSLPDVPSAAALPAHSPGDPVFLITPNGGGASVQNAFNYNDWGGIAWQATTSGGWFDQTCLGDSSGKKCQQSDSFIASIKYLDWSGASRIASRLGPNFAISKGSPASTDKPCPADPKTGVTPATDFAQCSSYVSRQVQYTYQGNQYTMELTNAPGFSSATTIYFTSQGPQQTARVAAVGIPTPAISLASASSLPAGIGFAGSNALGNGNAQFTFSGSGTGTPGTYQVTLQAQNANGTTMQKFTIVIATQLQIIVPGLGAGLFGPTLGVPYGQPVSFAVNTTGVPPIHLFITPGFLPPGLNFQDNGNGTATISGTTTAAGFYPTPGCIAGVTAPTCTPSGSITATGPQGSASLPFSVEVAAPPNPTLAVSTATFVAGASNAFKVTTTGAVVTPVAIHFATLGIYEPVPSWLTLQDNGNGTAVLSGTPPPGTSGEFFLQICPQAVISGSTSTFTCGPNFTLNVNDQPLFLNHNTATFTVGDPGSFTISTNQPSGSITEIGALPPGLEFTDNGNGTATISGTPAVGAGGSVTLQLSIASDFGTGTQALKLQVNEAVSFANSVRVVNFYGGQDNSFSVSVSGYPLLSSAPVAYPILNGATYVSGAEFAVTGLPADLSFSNLNPQGYNTGTLTLSGTPSSSDVGEYLVEITATNGVNGKSDSRFFTLNIEPVPGDVNRDGVVNCADLDLVRASFGLYLGQPGYDPIADINNDGFIDIKDLAIVARNLPKGTVCH